MNIYEKRKDKWKLPQDFLLGGNGNAAGNAAMDKNTADYRAGITWDGNTDSCYIFLWDSTENGWKKRNVKDSENSNFIYFGSKLPLKQNYGIDVNFLNNRLKVSADIFFEDRKDILIKRQTIPILSLIHI